MWNIAKFIGKLRVRTVLYIILGLLVAGGIIYLFTYTRQLTKNNSILIANQEFYKKEWENLKVKRDSLQTELDGVKVEIDSMKNLRPEIIVRREKAKKLILGLNNTQLQDFYDKKAKELQK